MVAISRTIFRVAVFGLSLVIVALITTVAVVVVSEQYKLTPHFTRFKPHSLTIPRVMYKTGKTEQVPNNVKDLGREFTQRNPGWRVEYYGDEAARKFIRTHFEDDVVLAFDALNPGAFKADLFRLCILYVRGGVYSDLSQRLLVPIRDIVDIRVDELVLVADKYIPMYYMQKEGVYNAFIAAVPKHDFLRHCIDKIVDRVRAGKYGSNPLDITGPYMLGRELHACSDLNYRMELVRSQHDNYIENIATGERMIQHKQPGHYKMLGVGGRTYTTDWYMHRVFDNSVRAHMSRS
jgi:mannosyltransferase OCH1-like enzyme